MSEATNAKVDHLKVGHLQVAPDRFLCSSKVSCYLRRRLASEGIVSLCVTLSRCVCVGRAACITYKARRIIFGCEGNALYPVLSSFLF